MQPFLQKKSKKLFLGFLMVITGIYLPKKLLLPIYLKTGLPPHCSSSPPNKKISTNYRLRLSFYYQLFFNIYCKRLKCVEFITDCTFTVNMRNFNIFVFFNEFVVAIVNNHCIGNWIIVAVCNGYNFDVTV